MDLRGLGIDEVRGVAARIETEQRIRQRAVAPEEAREMLVDQQVGKRVEQLVRLRHGHAPRDDVPERHRVLQEARDEQPARLVARLAWGAR